MARLFPLSILFYFVFLTDSYSQLQYPTKIKWAKISSSNFEVICPREISDNGQEAINLLEKLNRPISASLNKPTKPISLILNNQSVISNGYVSLSPRHMSWYINPMQDASMSLDGNDWIQNLAIHEYRHVVQFDKLDTGLINLASLITGDFGRGIATMFVVPVWFFEGDAVYSETIHSYGGRGRLPNFIRDNMAIKSEQKNYKYDKAYLGSYRDYVPNHYHLGYMLSSYVNKNYGQNTWNYVLKNCSKYPYSPIIFSSSLKTSTGFDLDKTYQNALNQYDSLWNIAMTKKRNINNYADTVFSPEKKIWTNYTFPFEISEKHFLAVKYGLSNTTTLVISSNDNEKQLIQLSEIDRIHSNGRKVVWATTFTDIRWGQKEFADIMVFDVFTKKRSRLTHKQRYFAPAISPDGNMIAAIEYTSDMQCSLVLLDASNGNLLDKHSVPVNEFLRMPSWSGDGKQLVLTRTKGQLKTLSVYNIVSKELKNIVDYTAENITNPVFYNNFILFNSALGDFDEIHAIDTLSKKRYCAITGKYGVYNPSVNIASNTINYQDYTVNGFLTGRIKVDTSKWIELPATYPSYKNYLHAFIPQSEPTFKVPELVTDTVYEIKRYFPLLHSLKVHSWLPIISNKGFGAQVLSNDYLNTTSLIAGAEYYPGDDATREFFNISYSGLYPVLSANFNYGNRYRSSYDKYDTTRLRRYDEKQIDLNVSLPFNFSRNSNNIFLTIDGGYIFSWQKYDTDSLFERSSINEKLYGWYSGLEFNAYKPLSRRDIQTPLGFDFRMNYLKTLENTNYKGSRFIIAGNLFLPGLALHHSLKFSGGHQQYTGDILENIYLSDSDLEPVRGRQGVYTATGFSKFTCNYTFPVAYPDINIPSTFYLKRIYTNLFFDTGVYRLDNNSATQQSVGLDLTFNFHLVRFLQLPFDMGLRYSRLLNENKNRFEILFYGIPIF